MHTVRIALVVVVAQLVACRGEERKQFGVVTEDGKAAFHEHCGDVKITTHPADPDNPDELLRKYDYVSTWCAKPFRGHLFVDLHSGRLLELSVRALPDEVDALSRRLVLPVLDNDQREAFAELGRFMESNVSGDKEWRHAKTSLSVSRLDVEDSWKIVLVPTQ